MTDEPDIAALIMKQRDEFQRDLSDLINKYSRENGSNTPDFVLAAYVMMCIDAFDAATKERDGWMKR